MAAGGNDLQFDHAVIEVVDALLADQAHHAPLGGFLAGRGDVPAGKIAGTDVDHLALLDQGVEALPGLVPGAVAVDVVHLVEVDPVGLQALEAALACLRIL